MSSQQDLEHRLNEMSIMQDNANTDMLNIDMYPKCNRDVPADVTDSNYAPAYSGDGRVLDWEAVPKTSDADTGDMFYWDDSLNGSAGGWKLLDASAADANQVLTLDGNKVPYWEDAGTGTLPAGTNGDILYYDSVWKVLPKASISTNGSHLKSNGGNPEWDQLVGGFSATFQLAYWNITTKQFVPVANPSNNGDLLAWDTTTGATWEGLSPDSNEMLFRGTSSWVTAGVEVFDLEYGSSEHAYLIALQSPTLPS